MNAELRRWTNAEHHASDAVGSTKLKEFMESPAMFHARYVAKTAEPRQGNAATELGIAFHMFLLEPAEFEKHYATMPVECNGGSRTKKVKLAREAFRQKYPFQKALTIDQMDDLCEMKRSVFENRKSRDLVEALGDPEVSITWTHPTGIACKARFDNILEDNVAWDLKTSTDASLDGWPRIARRLGYDNQTSLYLMGRDAVFGKTHKPFLHIVVSSEPPFVTTVFQLHPETLNWSDARVNRALDQMAKCYETGVWGHPGAHQINEVQL